MKITLKETITKEVELILPCWRKSKSAYYFITEKFHVEITSLDGWVTIETWATKPPLTALGDDSKAITHDEFQQAYEEALKKLEDKLFVDVRYEFQIVEGSIYIDEIVNRKANRQFRLKPDQIIAEWYYELNEVIDENHIMLEEYAMFHQNKWEEVPE